MKRFCIPLFLFIIAGHLFAQGFSALERRIVLAGPEEMLRLVLDRSLEKEMLAIINHFEDQGGEETLSAISAAFPGIREDECSFLLIKLALVASLGSGDEDVVETGMDILEFLGMIDFMKDFDEMDDDLQAFLESSYWKDCIAFFHLFDADAFLEERFPGIF